MTRVLTGGWLAAVLSVGVSVPLSAQPYSARQAGAVVQLEDTKHHTVVSIVPSVGNQAIEMNVKGHNIFRWTYASVADFEARPGMAGVPFLAPWADILDGQHKELQHIEPGGTWRESFWMRPSGF